MKEFYLVYEICVDNYDQLYNWQPNEDVIPKNSNSFRYKSSSKSLCIKSMIRRTKFLSCFYKYIMSQFNTREIDDLVIVLTERSSEKKKDLFSYIMKLFESFYHNFNDDDIIFFKSTWNQSERKWIRTHIYYDIGNLNKRPFVSNYILLNMLSMLNRDIIDMDIFKSHDEVIKESLKDLEEIEKNPKKNTKQTFNDFNLFF